MVRTVGTLHASLRALAGREKAFARVIESHGLPEPRSSEPGVETLLRTIVGQQVSVQAARSMWNKLVARLGQPVDLAVQIEIGRLMGLEEKPSEKQLREMAERWRPHRGAAAVLAWHSYNAPPLG